MNLETILTILITIAQITTVYLAARGNRWTWVFSIVTGLILCYNFFTDRHFMSFAFQVYSILASIGGVFIWKKKEEHSDKGDSKCKGPGVRSSWVCCCWSRKVVARIQ